KDCCALLSRHPRTRSNAEQLERLEARLLPNYEVLIERTLAEVRTLTFDAGELLKADPHPPASDSAK
ncbi:MAG TPA: hypothetical protein VFL97_01370, partial [Nitrococcus sp.]|nr:hypothetical protein [Nitrococcus sp.]